MHLSSNSAFLVKASQDVQGRKMERSFAALQHKVSTNVIRLAAQSERLRGASVLKNERLVFLKVQVAR